jgi:hypothetical protein
MLAELAAQFDELQDGSKKRGREMVPGLRVLVERAERRVAVVVDIEKEFWRSAV